MIKPWHAYIVIAVLAFIGGIRIINSEDFFIFLIGVGILGTPFAYLIQHFSKIKEPLWYYTDSVGDHGPIPESSIIELIKNKSIETSSMLMSDGLAQPIKITDIEKLITEINKEEIADKPKSNQGSQIIFLRVVRAGIGLLFGLQIIGLLPIFTWIGNPAQVSGNMLATLMFKVILLVLFGWLFFWLRSVINSKHQIYNRTGNELLNSRMAL